jgi:stage V sporulation protein G
MFGSFQVFGIKGLREFDLEIFEKLPPALLVLNAIFPVTAANDPKKCSYCGSFRTLSFAAMIVSEVRIKLCQPPQDKLLAYCELTLDDQFVVRDIRLIKSESGYIVAMPSRRASVACPACHHKNPLGAKFCNQCGKKIPAGLVDRDVRQYHDIAHPTNAEARGQIEQAIVAEYLRQLSEFPGPSET